MYLFRPGIDYVDLMFYLKYIVRILFIFKEQLAFWSFLFYIFFLIHELFLFFIISFLLLPPASDRAVSLWPRVGALREVVVSGC